MSERSPLLPTQVNHDRENSSTQRTLMFVAPYMWPKSRKLQMMAVLSIVFTLLSKLSNLAVPLALRSAVNSLTPGSIKPPLALWSVLAYVALRFGTNSLNQLRSYTWKFVSLDQTRLFGVATFAHLHGLSLSYHLKRKTGEVLRVMDRGVESLATLQSLFAFTIGPTLLELVIVCGVFVQFNSPLIAATTFVSVVGYAVFSVYITNWRVKLRRAMIEADNAVTDKATDSLLNFETVKYFGSEQVEVQRYGERLKEYQDTSLKTQFSLSLLNNGQALIVNVGVMVAMLLAAVRVASGSFTTGDFVMINAYILQLYGPLNWLGSAYRTISQAFTDLEKMIELSQIPKDVDDAPGAQPIDVTSGSVTFENVSFNYGIGTSGQLSNISFTIKPGKTTAIIGPTGSGKSTIVRLLLRFYDVHAGRILIDGQNISSVTQSSLRHAIGVVAQETVLFNDTLEYNVNYGKPEASTEEVQEAIAAAQLTDFVSHQPDGLGLRLSGGEKQRVGIARMVLKHPKVILLDESTSALDTRTERAVQAALNDVSKGKTTLVIAHRLSTIADADEILVLKNGVITERGTHSELMKIGEEGDYYTMWTSQAAAASSDNNTESSEDS
ncbi:hypothetical protein NDN08_003178 [Rhodosorus marinus]|uniref:Probable ATP-dependent transporter ycf16 n=1 Tax=Rhodosorus marinus TaxID=101924 RepID=A0AAV8UYH5_9RHOD|nr:hypothetical protein NDN08_003178 [Rhodosorus marinus]